MDKEKRFQRKMARRKQELEYIKTFTNEWQFRSYRESNKSKWRPITGIGIGFLGVLIGNYAVIQPILEGLF